MGWDAPEVAEMRILNLECVRRGSESEHIPERIVGLRKTLIELAEHYVQDDEGAMKGYFGLTSDTRQLSYAARQSIGAARFQRLWRNWSIHSGGSLLGPM
jgi:hypothetical protein